MNAQERLNQLKKVYNQNEQTIAVGESQIASITNRLHEELGLEVKDPTNYDFQSKIDEVQAEIETVENKMSELLDKAEALLG